MALSLSSASVTEGMAITATMSFGNLTEDSDRSTTDYIFRADVVDANDANADACEGDGLGVDRYMYQVDEDPEVRTGRISARCPAGDYTIKPRYLDHQRVGPFVGLRRPKGNKKDRDAGNCSELMRRINAKGDDATSPKAKFPLSAICFSGGSHED